MALANLKGEARVAGLNAKPYSFTDRQTGEKMEGVSRRLFVVVEDPQEPVIELTIPSDMALDIPLELGSLVYIEAEPRARNNRVVWSLVKATEVVRK